MRSMLGSWRRHARMVRFPSYDALAEAAHPLCPRIWDLPIWSCMPVSEHPLRSLLGLSADSGCMRADGEAFGRARRPSPALSTSAHEAGIGVILDWVPAHFPVG